MFTFSLQLKKYICVLFDKEMFFQLYMFETKKVSTYLHKLFTL